MAGQSTEMVQNPSEITEEEDIIETPIVQERSNKVIIGTLHLAIVDRQIIEVLIECPPAGTLDARCLLPAPSNGGTHESNRIEAPKAKNKKWLDRESTSLMVVASLIAGMAFAAGMNPPGGVWQDTIAIADGGGESKPHRAGFPIMATHFHIMFACYVMSSFVSFITAFSVVVLLMSSSARDMIPDMLPMGILWVSIISLGVTFVLATIAFVHRGEAKGSVISHIKYPIGAVMAGSILFFVLGFIVFLLVVIIKNKRQQNDEANQATASTT